jgi:nanoRNase/pAp phosphatase (c-di-AMP/oligoRNAs hydrolase)
MVLEKINLIANRDTVNGKVIEFNNYKTYIVNSTIKPGHISENIFENNKFNDVGLTIVWYRSYKLGIDKVSIRSRKDGNIDCSKIALKYGGNGHKNASGFIIKDINDIINI